MSRFLCLTDSNSYRGCVGIRCPYYDYRGTAPGCIFYPTLNVSRQLASESAERRARIAARRLRETEQREAS